jgi:hypothetical protein
MMTAPKTIFVSSFLLVTMLLTGCQFIGNTPPQSSPVLSPTPAATAEPVTNTDQNSITLEIPTVGQTVSTPFTVRGQAPGSWFFEGQLVGKLLDANGNLLTTAPLMADGEWMTTETVTFEGAMSYSSPSTPTEAILRIENDNPSGLEEMQKFAEFPVVLQ